MKNAMGNGTAKLNVAELQPGIIMSAANDDGSTLTKRLAAHTKQIHYTSDRLVNVQLALVLTSRTLYGESISLFGEIFGRIESILERHKDHPQLRHFQPLLKQCHRADRFREDVSYYLTTTGGDASNRNAHPPPELASYLDRLDTLEKEDPTRLIAYVYHMYMAIFAGGYIIKTTVQRAFGLPKDSDEGVRAFTVGNCDSLDIKEEDTSGTTRQGAVVMNPKRIRTEMKRIMNDVIAPTLSDEEVEGLMEESLYVFRGNNAVVSSVKKTQAFASAKERCTKFIIMPLFVTIVAIIFGILMTWGKK